MPRRDTPLYRDTGDQKIAGVESLQEMDAEHLAFDDQSFDVAVAMFLITVVPDPLKVLAGCLLFGFSDALALRLQTFGFPSYLVLTVPYLVALAALFALAYRSRPRIVGETVDSMKRLMRIEGPPDAGAGRRNES